MNCHIYLRKGTVFLPTMGKMDEGFYRGVEPVTAVAASDAAGVRRALQTTMARGNPTVPMLRRGTIPPPVLLKHAGLKSWSQFEKGMRFWTIKERSGTFRIAGQRRELNGGWKEDPEQTIDFGSGASLDEVIDRMIAILQEAAAQK